MQGVFVCFSFVVFGPVADLRAMVVIAVVVVVVVVIFVAGG